jgi:hypothetical protein
MKKALFILFALLLVSGLAYATTAVAGTDSDNSGDAPAASEDKPDLGVYACPDAFSEEGDPYLTTDPDAKCPICEMGVEKVDELYVCPDHPAEFSNDPDAVCAETGHAYVPVEQLYVCPMHPDQISADPDAKCEICGMNMKAVEVSQDNGDDDSESMASSCPHMGSGSGCGGCGNH